MSRAFLLFAACMCGCTGDKSPGSVAGTVHDQTLTVDDAVSAVVMIPDLATNDLAPAGLILMGDATALCADLTARSQPISFHSVYIGLGVQKGSGSTPSAPDAAATFTISTSATQPDVGSLGVLVTDANCQDVPADDARATSGTVTLTDVDGDRFTGQFDVTLDSGDHIVGAFNPEPCAGLENWANDTIPLSCP
jgi:hypothetical protein